MARPSLTALQESSRPSAAGSVHGEEILPRVRGWTENDDLPTGWMQFRTPPEAISAAEDADINNDDSIVKMW